jgi:phage protein D
MSTVKQPLFKIFYNGKNLTEELTKYLLLVRYTDKLIGESDDIELSLEDTDRRWIDGWYPTKGDRIKLQMGYVGGLLDCGEFEIDEITLDGPPDKVTLKGIAAWVTTPMRTRDSKAHENKTLKEIAQHVADKLGLELVGDIYTIRIARSTQNREADISYLYRMATQFGYVFSIRGTKLIFTSVYDLENGTPVKTLDRTDLSQYNFTDKTSETYGAARVSYQDPGKKTVTTYEIKTEVNADNIAFNKVVKKDVLIIKEKAENKQQAELMAKAALHAKNSLQQKLNFTTEGDPLLVAGNNIEVTGFGQLSGKYQIIQSTHNNDKDAGYTTECECKRVGYITKVKQKPKKKRKERPVTYVITEGTVNGDN